MRITRVAIRNFRLLEKVELSFDENTTVIVGRNNSGKTSLTELFRRLSDGPLGSALELGVNASCL
jgi:predicted ATP-dependent endonuclease of OLD family